MLSVKRGATFVALAILASGTAVATAKKPSGGFKTTTKAYLVGVPGTGFSTEPLLTAGDLVPVTDSPNEHYQMVGIPDGLGAVTDRPGVTRVFMNHELNSNVQSHPYADRAEHQRGASSPSTGWPATDPCSPAGARSTPSIRTTPSSDRPPIQPTQLGLSAASAPASWPAARPASTDRST